MCEREVAGKPNGEWDRLGSCPLLLALAASLGEDRSALIKGCRTEEIALARDVAGVDPANARRANVVRQVRGFTQRHVAVRSRRSFRHRVIPVSGPPRLIPAASRYRGMGWLPTDLVVPESLPKEAKLPLTYVLGYYGLGKALFWGYRRSPIPQQVPWTPELPWSHDFLPPVTESERPVSDANYVTLRTQGPNPFLLAATSPEDALGDDPNGVYYEVDFSCYLEGLAPGVRARFKAADGGGLVPSVIVEGDHIHHPASPTWEGAKHLVNAVDARLSVFVNHLLYTHLTVGQAYAVAAWRLPNWHPLRPICDFFTYGTMAVNDFAYRSLLSKSSYFMMSNFLSLPSARVLVENGVQNLRFSRWLPMVDLAERGVEDLAGYPYGEDAKLVWPVIEGLVREHLSDLQIDHADIAADLDLYEWHLSLRRAMPDGSGVPELSGLESLVDLLSAMIYNNVVHEVCGNFQPLVAWADGDDRVGLHFDDYLAARADGVEPPSPRASDALLLDQGAVASTVNVVGNNLLTLNIGRVVDDPQLERSLRTMQRRLRELAPEIDARNTKRDRPFTAMEPHRWEASISY